MEYVAGRHTLRDVIRDEAPLSPARALTFLEEVLKAIAAAHEAGIIHRDIKPENVLIDPRGRLKVADFGLARAISAATAATATSGVLMGTVSYLPPELVTDGMADARSDVYALGVMTVRDAHRYQTTRRRQPDPGRLQACARRRARAVQRRAGHPAAISTRSSRGPPAGSATCDRPTPM